MRFFSSRRERRLWLWTLAVVVAIYSTLGLTGMLAGFLREHGLGAPLFLLFMFLVAATVVTHGIKARAGRAEIAVGLGVATAYLLVLLPHVDSGGAVAPHRIRRSGRLDLRSTRRACEPGAPRPVAATARRRGDYGAGRARRGHPVVSAHSRLRSAGHPVQLPCGRDGHHFEHRAGMGAAADDVPPGARQRQSISTARTTSTCPPWLRCRRSSPTVATARANPGIKRCSQSETVSSIASSTRYGSVQSWLYRNLASRMSGGDQCSGSWTS